jgi:GNAT superfamily N-acetyltransferase
MPPLCGKRIAVINCDGFEIEIFEESDLSYYFYFGDIRIGHCYLTPYQKEITPRQKEKTIEIDDFKIEKDYRGKGYGSKLWMFLENHIKKKYSKKSHKYNEFIGGISITDDFDRASRFWHKMGFEVVDNRSSSKTCIVGQISKKICWNPASDSS